MLLYCPRPSRFHIKLFFLSSLLLDRPSLRCVVVEMISIGTILLFAISSIHALAAPTRKPLNNNVMDIHSLERQAKGSDLPSAAAKHYGVLFKFKEFTGDAQTWSYMTCCGGDVCVCEERHSYILYASTERGDLSSSDYGQGVGDEIKRHFRMAMGCLLRFRVIILLTSLHWNFPEHFLLPLLFYFYLRGVT